MLLPRDLSCPKQENKCLTDQKFNLIKGEWNDWTSWSLCSATCGINSFKQRTRICSILNGCEGSNIDQSICPNITCSFITNREAQWTDWTSWNQCSVKMYL